MINSIQYLEEKYILKFEKLEDTFYKRPIKADRVCDGYYRMVV